jgi:hypothetical protein
MLQVEGNKHAAPEMRRVVALHDVFTAIGERALILLVRTELCFAAYGEIKLAIAWFAVPIN